MFKLTYRPTYNRDKSRTDYFNDTKDLANFILSLTNNKTEADSAYKWCNNATFGSHVTRQPNYKIECFNENEFIKETEQKVISKITEALGLNYKCLGLYNEQFTWDIGDRTNFITYNPNDGYGILIQKRTQYGVEEVWSTVNKDANKFITDAIIGVEKIISKQLKSTRNIKINNSTWHKHYFSGKSTKQHANDAIEFYYKDNGDKIVVSYTDFRHNKAACYAPIDKDGNRLGSFSKLYEAQKVLDMK